MEGTRSFVPTMRTQRNQIQPDPGLVKEFFKLNHTTWYGSLLQLTYRQYPILPNGAASRGMIVVDLCT